MGTKGRGRRAARAVSPSSFHKIETEPDPLLEVAASDSVISTSGLVHKQVTPMKHL